MRMIVTRATDVNTKTGALPVSMCEESVAVGFTATHQNSLAILVGLDEPIDSIRML